MNKLKLIFSFNFGVFPIFSQASIQLDLSIKGQNFDIVREISIGEPGSEDSTLEFEFQSSKQNKYTFKLEHKNLPSNRSYPKNLDVTISDAQGKIAYLFYALNNLEFLRQVGRFGLILETSDGLADVQFFARSHAKGDLEFRSLGDERFIQDTLLENKGFQMIRPVTLPVVSPGIRQRAFPLDQNPYSVEFLMSDVGEGRIQFEHNFYRINGSEKHLSLGVYFNAKNLLELREVMFAAKHFRLSDSPAKIVFYPALGQTDPIIKDALLISSEEK